jgi:hypothetical protein
MMNRGINSKRISHNTLINKPLTTMNQMKLEDNNIFKTGIQNTLYEDMHSMFDYNAGGQKIV